MIRLHEIKRSLPARKVQFYAKGKFMNERLAYREPFPYSKTEGEYAAMKKQLTKKIICIAVIIAIGCVAFFVLAPRAENPANYPKTIETLDSIENKAIVMTGTSIALATAAALVPGDATTPIANKLADIAGYMIIVYIAIIIEKYLLALTGVVTFKILIPIALALIALSIALPAIGDRIHLKKAGVKFILIGIMMWILVPTSTAVTNLINDTYDANYGAELKVEENAFETLDEIEDTEKAADKSDKTDKTDQTAKNEEQKEEEGFSLKKMWDSMTDKTSEVTNSVKAKASVGVVEFQNSLNNMLEGVAVMIVTTCVIPIAVLFLFLWIVKAITGMKFKDLKTDEANHTWSRLKL